MVLAALLVPLAVTTSADARPGCAARLVQDWRDGRIDLTYPVSCYRRALAQLPEDVRVYSSAQTDITRALQARVAKVHVQQSGHQHDSGGVSPLLVVAITAGILVAAGSVAAAVR